MTDRNLRLLARGIFALVIVELVVSAAFAIATGRAGSDSGLGGGEIVFLFAFLLFPIVGVVLASRRPGNSLGWILLVIGVFAFEPLTGYADLALATGRPGGVMALALTSWTWVPMIVLAGVYVLLLFPDGHLPSPRWRWFAWAIGVGSALTAVTILLTPGDFSDTGYPDIQNPLAIDALDPFIGVLFAALLTIPLGVIGAAASLFVRARRADPIERLQIRWLATAAAIVAVSFAVAMLASLGGPGQEWASNGVEGFLQALALAAFGLIPIAIGVAVLRYRLYDLDIVIRKTLVVAAVVGFVAVVYLGIVAGIGALAGSTGNVWLSAVAAIVVAVLFPPVRARARRLADRIVYGKRATPYEVLTSFGGQLAGTYSADDVLARIARVLGEGVGATRARVWLRVGDELRAVATWPDHADAEPPDDLTAPVRHTGEELGALSVAMSAVDPMDPTKEKLVRDLAAQTGLVLSNVRLTEELRARLDDLRAAQKRLVAAQDEERKRIERNIHDGAQQQLVALAVKLRLTEALVDRDPAKARETLAQLQGETGQALDDLRDLARGIYPPLLADRGLVAALEAQARKAPVPVTIEAGGVERASQEIEAAVYFSILEALQNVSKYAGASEARVALSRTNGHLAFTVVDDGRGFDPVATGYGTGLQGIADRLGALDGRLEIISAPGRGTTVVGEIPL